MPRHVPRVPQRRAGLVARALALALALAVVGPPRPAAAQAPVTLAEVPYPTTIRVAIRESRPGGEPDPQGRILYVADYDFDYYGKNVLPREWYPGWEMNALQAGAVAIKMFAWYHVLNPVVMDGYEFAVDNTVNFQVFIEGQMYDDTNAAWDSMRPYAYVAQNGEIIELNYRAGFQDDPNWQYRNAQKMAQWGSQYWARQGRTALQILQFYYEGRVFTRIPGS